MMRALVVVALSAGCAGAPKPTPAPPPATPAHELAAISLYGTRQLTLDQLLAADGNELRAFAEARMNDDPHADWAPIEAKINRLGDFVYVKPGLVGYYGPGVMKEYLTIDIVDRADAARRMPFLPAPTGTYADPEGLLADWRAYETKVQALTAAKRMSFDRVECPAFHCLGDATHPEVKALADKLAARAPAHLDELATILRDDHDDDHRASAAYLLAYGHDGPRLVQQMLASFRDPSALVRNNAMRVISDIAFFHREVAVPIEPALAALDYPSTLDRNKAAAVVDGLLERPDAAPLFALVTRQAGATLLAMLRLQQPNNHNFAYRIFKTISGEQLGEFDDAAWEAWLRAHQGS